MERKIKSRRMWEGREKSRSNNDQSTSDRDERNLNFIKERIYSKERNKSYKLQSDDKENQDRDRNRRTSKQPREQNRSYAGPQPDQYRNLWAEASDDLVFMKATQ